MKFLAGIARDDQQNVQIYSVADLDFGPELLDQEVFPTYNPSIEANGALDFGGNTYLFALDENNGVMAFLLDPSYLPPLTHFKILSATASGTDVILTWEARSGTSYQVQYADALDGTPRDQLDEPGQPRGRHGQHGLVHQRCFGQQTVLSSHRPVRAGQT